MENGADILEKDFLDTFCNFPKAGFQINEIHESDAEIFELNGTRIAATTDTIVEEIEQGIYTDPFTIGWMSVVINLSDLAAVGAAPVGLLLNQTFKKMWSKEFIAKIQDGVLQACHAHNTYVLGGDTNFSTVGNIGATAIGTVPNDFMTRKSCAPGDLLFATGKLGAGNAYGFKAIHNKNVRPFTPMARIKEGKILKKYASSCIDSSDGLFSSLCTLGILNGVGFSLTTLLKDIICVEALLTANESDLPPWIFLAGILGEYELTFTIPKEKSRGFLEDFKMSGFEAVFLGEVRNGDTIRFTPEVGTVASFTFDELLKINHSFHCPEQYIGQLILLGRETSWMQ